MRPSQDGVLQPGSAATAVFATNDPLSEKHAKMMKAHPAMKAGMMGKDQFMVFARNVFVDPGKIGGN